MTSLSVSITLTGHWSSRTGAEVESTLKEGQAVELPRNKVAVLVQGVKQWFAGTSTYLQEQVALPFADEVPLLSQGVGGGQVDTHVQQPQLRDEAPMHRLQSYLRHLRDSGELSQNSASLAWLSWNQLRKATFNSLPVPDACPGPDGQLLFTWDKDEHHFELEIFPGGEGEFFYRNRVSGELWEAEYMVGQAIPSKVTDKLGLFL